MFSDEKNLPEDYALGSFEVHHIFHVYNQTHFVKLRQHDGMFVEFETRLYNDQ